MFRASRSVITISIACQCLGVDLAYSEADSSTAFGTYSFAQQSETKDVTRNGHPVRACRREETIELLKVPFVVKYSRDGVTIDGTQWRVWRMKDNVAAKPLDRSLGDSVALAFSRAGALADGVLYVWRFDDQGKVVCVDGRRYTGLYKK